MSESDVEETSVLCIEVTFLGLPIFFTALSGFLVVAADDREKLGSLRMEACLLTKSAKKANGRK